MSQRSKPPDDIAPEEFFVCWVPEAVASDEHRRTRLGDTRATIVFELDGDGGGVFGVAIEAGRIEGFVGDREPAELRVCVDIETWRALNRGDLSAPEAMLRRRLQLRGSFLLALKLHLILG